MKVVFLVALSFLLCCCGVKGDPEKPPSEISEEQLISKIKSV